MGLGKRAELVLGSVQLGLAYGAANRTGKPSRMAALSLLRRAAEEGVRAYDTARAYGDAEDRLGEALEGRACAIVTKLAPLSELAPGTSRRAIDDAVDTSIAQSLSALRTAQLACLLLHRATHLSAFGGAVWQRVLHHRASGLVDRLGVSVQSPQEALMALDEPLVTHIQLPFNILDWRWAEAGVISRLKARNDVTVHVRSVFLQGLLAASDAQLWPRVAGVNAMDILSWIAKKTHEFGRQSAADFCLAYVRGMDWIDGVVVGQETEDQLETNLRLMACAPLSSAECAAIEASRQRVPLPLLDPAQWPKR